MLHTQKSKRRSSCRPLSKKIELHPDKPPDANGLKHITFNVPKSREALETVMSLVQQKPDDLVKVGIDADKLAVTKAESKATYIPSMGLNLSYCFFKSCSVISRYACSVTSTLLCPRIRLKE